MPATSIRQRLRRAPNRLDAQGNRLIEENLGLVRQVIGKLLAHLPTGVDVDNLYSAGTLGLVEAARKFDPQRGIKFETYSYTRIRGAVLDELRRNCPVPQHKLELVNRVRKAYDGMPPGVTIDQIAAKTGLTTDQVADCLAAVRMTRMISLDRTESAADCFVPDRRDLPDVCAEKEEAKRLLAEAIAALPERQRLVVTLYYLEDQRLREIGIVLQLSESRVCRLLSAALFAIGQFIQSRGGAPSRGA